MAIPVFPTVDKWPLRPFDPKCKKFVPFDPVVDDQIRCKVPLWSGDFGELKPELIAQGLRLDELSGLDVHDVGQFVIRAAQGGSLRAGPIGTAAHTIVTLSPAAGETSATVDDMYATIARDLSDNSRSLLRFLDVNAAYDCAGRYPQADIADELGVTTDALRVARRQIAKLALQLIESKEGSGGGIWLSPAGKKVAARIPPETCRQIELAAPRLAAN